MDIDPTRAYDVMGWICLSITSYLLAIGLGVWIGRVSTYLGPWLDGILDHCINKFRCQPVVAPLTTAPSDSGNVQDTECPPRAMPKARPMMPPQDTEPPPVAMFKARPPMPPRTMPPRPMSTPTLYEDSSHRYHWDASCVHLQQASPVNPLEPCSVCTEPTTFLRENSLYRTVKGERYHKRSCSHVRFKLPGTTLQTPTARAMLPCSCVAEMLEECLRSGSWNNM